jgi:hypothetical protein
MSMVEDVRKVVQDFIAPELRSISTRMDASEKQRGDDKVDILRAFESMEKQRIEDKADMLRAFAHMEKRFELVVDYTKVLRRVEKLEEAQQSKSN